MSMSTHIVGIKPPDDKWKKMKAVWDACEKAGIGAPNEVSKFFGYETPDSKGVVVEIKSHPAVREFSDEGVSGYEVDVSKLDKDITIIRFYNSW